MYTFVLHNQKGIRKEVETLRDGQLQVLKDIEFVDIVKTNDKSKFQEIKQPKVRRLLRKPRNKFMLFKNLINKQIYQESKIKTLFCVSRIASQVWSKRSTNFDKYLTYLAMLEEEHHLWIYNYIVGQNTFLSVASAPVTRVRKISSDTDPGKAKKHRCVFRNYQGMIKDGKGIPGLKKVNESKTACSSTADYNLTRIEDVYLAG